MLDKAQLCKSQIKKVDQMKITKIRSPISLREFLSRRDNPNMAATAGH